MRYPEFLKDRGTIGFVAPSMGCTTEPYRSAFDNAIKRFHSMGYKTIEGPNCRCDSGIGISNTPKKCAEELNESYVSADSDVLISCGGGELMCEVVPYIDFERVKQSKPKWYMGYSDNTNFTFLEATIADTAGIYGPCAGSSIPTVAKESRLTMRGRLLGGCMDCLINLLGTSFDHVREFNERYSDDGIIWFLEACDLNVMGMRRAMWQMKNAGWFSNVKGFLIGRPAHFGEEMFGIDHRQALSSLLREFNVPIIMDLDIGHMSPMMPVVCGSMADVSFDGSNFTISYDIEQ